MVGRFVKDQNIACLDHHAGEKYADFLTTGKNTHFLSSVFTGKKHTSKETTNISSIFDLRILCQPVYDQKISIKDCCIVLREIGLACCHAPLIRAGIRFHFTGDDLE